MSLMTKEQRAKTKNAGMNRASARSFHKELVQSLVALKENTDEKDEKYRAKRRAKRREAAKVKNKNRRLSK